MGSGKSTIGAPLAIALGRRFVDNDVSLERATGCSAAQIAVRDGPEALHRLEAEVLREALREPEPSVIAAAASTITADEVRRALRAGARVVWLRADPATLAARMPSSAARPFQGVDAAQLVAEQARERDALFAQAADVTVDTGVSDVEVLVRELVGRLT